MSKGQNVGYMRVSSEEQNTARQLVGIELDRVFEDKCSGKDTGRKALQECLAYVREGDVLHVHSIDRLARNLSDLQNIVAGLNERGVSVQFHKENLTFSAGQTDPMSKLMLQMMGAFAEFERNMIRERQREGIAIAKAAGKYKGGQPKLTAEQAEEIKRRHAGGESVSALAREYGVTRPTIYGYLKDA